MSLFKKLDAEQLLNDSTHGSLSDSEIKQLCRHAISRVRLSGFASFVIGTVLILLLVGLDVQSQIVLQFQLPGWMKWPIALLIFIAFATVGTLLEKWQLSVIRKLLANKLAEFGVRPTVCLACEYSLKGSISQSCPECGVPLAEIQSDNDD